MLNLELILIDKLGFDLSKNSYALNETIRVLIRTIVPFLILLLVSLVSVPDDKKRLDHFFVKMKTPVNPNPEIDKREMELSYQNPQRFDHLKLFPNTNWELNKWNKVDGVGFLVSVLVLIGIIVLLKVLLSIGG